MSEPDSPSAEPGPDEPASAIEVLEEHPLEELSATRLSDWVCRVTAEVAPDASSFVVRMSDSAVVQELNSRYRGKDAPTDVLSFPGDVTPEGRHLGDVVVDVPVARRQAEEAGHSFEIELKTLILHGILHCLGYDHETDQGQMSAREMQLRQKWIETDA